MLLIAIIVLVISSLSIRAGLNGQTQIKEYEKSINEREQGVLKRQQIKQSPTLKDNEIESIKNEANFINGIINQHVYPYDRFFDSLENSIPKGVVLSSFEMTKDFNRTILNGAADSMNDITLFLNNLNNSTIYKNSTLINLSVSPEGQTPETPASKTGITFEIESVIVKDEVWK
jgi:Tfp pilus assembly protein PilN